MAKLIYLLPLPLFCILFMKYSTKIRMFRVSGRCYIFGKKRIVKNRKFGKWKISISDNFYFSKLSSRPQVNLINIDENFGVFIFYRLPVLMRYMLSICNFMFRKSITLYFCFQFLTSYSVWYSYVQKIHRVSDLAFGTNFFFKKLHPVKPGIWQNVSMTSRA